MKSLRNIVTVIMCINDKSFGRTLLITLIKSKMNSRSIFLSLVFVLLFSCTEEEITVSKEAEDFLNEVLTILEKNSIKRNEIDWIDFRNQVFENAGTPRNIEEAYGTVRLALTLLGDNHSFLKKADGVYISGSYNVSCYAEDVEAPSLPDDIGYITVNSFSGSNKNKMIAFAEAIQEKIKTTDNANIAGWIVDLRGNKGGNMWPMLAGIGPILGEGTAGYFIDPENIQTSWGYSNGASTVNQTPYIQLSNPYELINPNPKVAVLLDNAIASSGEAIAVSFIGRNNTKSFGSATCGLSTANLEFNLSDNSTLFLTVSYMADRNKNKYGVPIIPDVEADSQEIIQLAIKYLEN